jgi:hypothetical protein
MLPSGTLTITQGAGSSVAGRYPLQGSLRPPLAPHPFLGVRLGPLDLSTTLPATPPVLPLATTCPRSLETTQTSGSVATAGQPSYPAPSGSPPALLPSSSLGLCYDSSEEVEAWRPSFGNTDVDSNLNRAPLDVYCILCSRVYPPLCCIHHTPLCHTLDQPAIPSTDHHDCLASSYRMTLSHVRPHALPSQVRIASFVFILYCRTLFHV